MFRSLAFQLTGSEDNHMAVRTLITRFENLNKKRFERFLVAEVNEPTMKDHIKRLLQPATWGTHVELFALATYLQVPVYYCVSKPGFKWERINPLGPSTDFRYPCTVADDPMHPSHWQKLSHFELYYNEGKHYDPVVSCESATVATQPPPLLELSTGLVVIS